MLVVVFYLLTTLIIRGMLMMLIIIIIIINIKTYENIIHVILIIYKYNDTNTKMFFREGINHNSS